MKRHGASLVLAALGLACTAGCVGNLPPLSDGAVITVWRSLPGRGLRTGAEVVAADVTDQRDLFLGFYRRTQRVGVCDPIELQRALGARGLMIVQYSAPDRRTVELHILRSAAGTPLTVGHGAIDVFAREMTSPKYRYTRTDVEALADWLDRSATGAGAEEGVSGVGRRAGGPGQRLPFPRLTPAATLSRPAGRDAPTTPRMGRREWPRAYALGGRAQGGC